MSGNYFYFAPFENIHQIFQSPAGTGGIEMLVRFSFTEQEHQKKAASVPTTSALPPHVLHPPSTMVLCRHSAERFGRNLKLQQHDKQLRWGSMVESLFTEAS